MSETKPESIEEIVIGECPACNQRAAFLYTGLWKGEHGSPDLLIYNCFECGSTRSKESIKPI